MVSVCCRVEHVCTVPEAAGPTLSHLYAVLLRLEVSSHFRLQEMFLDLSQLFSKVFLASDLRCSSKSGNHLTTAFYRRAINSFLRCLVICQSEKVFHHSSFL